MRRKIFVFYGSRSWFITATIASMLFSSSILAEVVESDQTAPLDLSPDPVPVADANSDQEDVSFDANASPPDNQPPTESSIDESVDLPSEPDDSLPELGDLPSEPDDSLPELGDLPSEPDDSLPELGEPTETEQDAIEVTDQMAPPANQRVLEEVIVQAERRSATLQNTAVAVTALSQSALTENDLVDVTDLTGAAPGLVVSAQEDQSDIKIYIRGVGTNNPTETGDQGVGVYVDDIFAARAQGALSLFYDLENVQVLRGPQGTLFGRNNTGGALLLRTRRPGDKLEGDLQVTYGTFNRQQLSGGLSLPLTSRWGIRAASYFERDEGWVNAVTVDPRGSDHNFGGLSVGRTANPDTKLNNRDVRSARLTSLWEIADPVSWLLTFETFTDRSINGLVLDPVLVNRGIYQAFIDSPVSLDLNSDVWRSNLLYNVNDAFDINYLFGYSNLHRTQVVDQDAGIASRFQEARTEYQDSVALSHELKFSGRVFAGRDYQVLEWTAGYFYFAEETGIRFDFDGQGAWLQGGATFIQPARGSVSQAAYGQISYFPIENLGLTVGLRFTDDLKYDRGGRNYQDCEMSFIRPTLTPLSVFEDFVDNQSGVLEPDGLDDKTGLERTRGQCAAGTRNDVEKESDQLTYLARISYKHDSHLFYLSVGSGYRAGVIQDAGESTEPETSLSYEIGAKLDFDILRLNLAGFFIDYDELIRSGFDNQLNRIVNSNVSAAEITGLEAELTVLIGSGGRLDFAASWLNAEYVDYVVDASAIGQSTNNTEMLDAQGQPTGFYDLAGNILPQAPELQVNLGFRWEFRFDNSSLTPRLQVLYSSDVYFRDSNDNRTAVNNLINDEEQTGFALGNPAGQNAYSKINLGLMFGHDNGWSVDLFVNNLTEEMTRSSVTGDNGTSAGLPGRYGAPRTAGLRFNIDF